MKKIISLLIIIAIACTVFAGCKEKNKTTMILFSENKIENYVNLGKYKDIEVDRNSADYKEFFDSTYEDDVMRYGLYTIYREKETIKNGDFVNLDYEGKIDGVAFAGGTSTGYTLEIGSGTFIDDFEEELIGAAIGETRDVTAKFPENYGEASLAGKEAVFTCKINDITRFNTIEEAYAKIGFDSAEQYRQDLESRAIKGYLKYYVCSKSIIKEMRFIIHSQIFFKDYSTTSIRKSTQYYV